MKKLLDYFWNKLEKGSSIAALIMFCLAMIGFTVVCSLWAIPGLILGYLVYKSSMFLISAAPFKANADSGLEMFIGYNAVVLSCMGIFLLCVAGLGLWDYFVKKNKNISFKFFDVLIGIKKFGYFWFMANVFILMPVFVLFLIAGFFLGSGGETCNLLVCY